MTLSSLAAAVSPQYIADEVTEAVQTEDRGKSMICTGLRRKLALTLKRLYSVLSSTGQKPRISFYT